MNFASSNISRNDLFEQDGGSDMAVHDVTVHSNCIMTSQSVQVGLIEFTEVEVTILADSLLPLNRVPWTVAG